VAFTPLLVPGSMPVYSAIWKADVWRVPPDVSLPVNDGTFLYTAAGELVGLLQRSDAGSAIVPARTIYELADRLWAQPARRRGGWLGLEVTSIRGALSAATAVDRGLIVTAVDPASSARGHLEPGDVILQVNGTPITSDDEWIAATGRLAPGDRVRLLLNGAEMPIEVEAKAVPAPRNAIGVTLQRTAAGALVVAIQPDSPADRAGLQAGDVITYVQDIAAPTPAQVHAAAAAADAPLLAIVARDGRTRAVALESHGDRR
jgi:serine protease Do